MEADSTARQSKYAKTVERRHSAAERAREQSFGRAFNATLRSNGPAVLAHIEAMPADCFDSAKLSAIIPALFLDYRWPINVPHDPRHHGAFLAYLLTRHGLSPADVAELGDGELLNLLIDDIRAVLRPRGRKRKAHTPDEQRIIDAWQFRPRAHKEIARDLGLSTKLVRATLRNHQTRVRRERQKARQ